MRTNGLKRASPKLYPHLDRNWKGKEGQTNIASSMLPPLAENLFPSIEKFWTSDISRPKIVAVRDDRRNLVDKGAHS